ncbi:GNAT family N-acetyltransferase [Yoonia sp. MH D7]
MKLDTERLRLEPFAPEHASGLHAMDSDSEVMRYIGATKTLVETNEGIIRVAERWERLGYGWWAIIEKGTGDLVGAACVQDAGHVEGAPLEIGWRLIASAQGKGYAAEAGEAAMNFAFHHLNVDLVIAVADQDNIASHKVMKRLGMTYQGIQVHYDLPLITYVKHRSSIDDIKAH